MSQRALRILAAAIIVVPLLAYPVVADGRVEGNFPSRDDCAQAPSGDPGEQLDVVYARLDDPVAATALLDELTRTGFVGAEVVLDPCGRWVVFYDPVDSLEQAEALARQVRDAGFDARVEVET